MLSADYYNIITSLLSVVSIVVAFYALYFTQMNPAKLSSIIGPEMQVCYTDYQNGDEGLGILLPVTFANSGARTGIVVRASLLLYRKDTPNQRFYLQWDHFEKLYFDKNVWAPEDTSHPLAVAANSTTMKVIWFMWHASSKPKLVIREGTYVLVFCFWNENETMPRTESHEISFDSEMCNALESYRSKKEESNVAIRLDTYQANQAMTSDVSSKLLGA